MASAVAPLRIYWVLLCKNCVAARESEARAGCNYDRWGHPYAGCLDPQKPNESRRSDFSPVKQRGKLPRISPTPFRVRRTQRQ